LATKTAWLPFNTSACAMVCSSCSRTQWAKLGNARGLSPNSCSWLRSDLTLSEGSSGSFIVPPA